MKKVSNGILIETLSQDFSNILSDGFIGMLIECCAMSLHLCNHQSGEATLLPHESKENIFEHSKNIFWEIKIDDVMLRTHNDESRTTDFGAMCMSLLLMNEIIGGEYLWTTSPKGDGVDFWLTDPNTFNAVARLEISGIRRANTKNNVPSRLSIKKNQTKKSDDSNVNAYISIVEFSKPTAVIVKL